MKHGKHNLSSLKHVVVSKIIWTSGHLMKPGWSQFSRIHVIHKYYYNIYIYIYIFVLFLIVLQSFIVTHVFVRTLLLLAALNTVTLIISFKTCSEHVRRSVPLFWSDWNSHPPAACERHGLEPELPSTSLPREIGSPWQWALWTWFLSTCWTW